MRFTLQTMICFFLFSNTADACELEGCALPQRLHQIDGKDTPPAGVWTWLHHDLALTRDAIRRGNAAEALIMAKQIDAVIRTRLHDLLQFGGTEAVVDFHSALAALVTNAGGWPLPKIDIGGPEAQG